ncbi:MAG: ATP synthase F1 subunit epsilon [Candidatus Marinimicrobia bacterium]|jgi:F-type H+-transporting ATPase subunit epsilon|nr:ATP synthase F1 subunit epsilon [Candidatus Neomarinimicrobiota bacterium]
MSSYNVEIVTPIREIKLGDVSYLRCPGLDGSFGVMRNHREGIFALSVGEVKVTQNGKDEYFATSGGFAEILNDSVKLLVESLERSNEIDADRANKSFERAQERRIKQDSELNETRIEASLVRALNRLRISKR